MILKRKKTKKKKRKENMKKIPRTLFKASFLVPHSTHDLQKRKLKLDNLRKPIRFWSCSCLKETLLDAYYCTQIFF